MNPNMYINPALVMMVFAMLTAFIAVGGLLWRLAGRLAIIETNLENLGRQLNTHIAECGPGNMKKSFRSGD